MPGDDALVERVDLRDPEHHAEVSEVYADRLVPSLCVVATSEFLSVWGSGQAVKATRTAILARSRE
jgi:hypothetical protein